MPVLIIGIVLVALFICFALLYLKQSGKEINVKKRGLNIIIFVLSSIALLISLKLFWNMGVYADEYNSSPVLVSGGSFWLLMDWSRLGLLFLISLISGLSLFKN